MAGVGNPESLRKKSSLDPAGVARSRRLVVTPPRDSGTLERAQSGIMGSGEVFGEHSILETEYLASASARRASPRASMLCARIAVVCLSVSGLLPVSSAASAFHVTFSKVADNSTPDRKSVV